MSLLTRFRDERAKYRDLSSKPPEERARLLRRLMLQTAALSFFFALSVLVQVPWAWYLVVLAVVMAIYCLFMAWLLPRKLRGRGPHT